MTSDLCAICGGALTWAHDHRTDNTGLDDGPGMGAMMYSLRIEL